MMKNKYRSELSQAKNLGSATSGSHHWWHQRFTALLLALMVIWVVNFCWHISKEGVSSSISLIQKPHNVVMLLLFTITMMYHGVLGMQVIIEDYVSCKSLRTSLLVAMKLFAIVTITCFIVAVIYVMIL